MFSNSLSLHYVLYFSSILIFQGYYFQAHYFSDQLFFKGHIMNTNKVLLLAVILHYRLVAQRTSGGQVDISIQNAISNNVTAPPSAKLGDC